MIVDLTTQFKEIFSECLQRIEKYQLNEPRNPESSSSPSNFLIDSSTVDDGFSVFKRKNHQQMIDRIPIEYQLSLKYAKDVQYSLQKISAILAEKKEDYFSNAAYSLNSFTNLQRNQFDEETKQALLSVSKQISQLQSNCERQLVNLQQKQSTLKDGAKVNQSYYGHLKEVILCLHQHFKQIQIEFSQFLKFNELRKKKIMSTLSIQKKNHQKQSLTHRQQKQPSFEKRNISTLIHRPEQDPSSVLSERESRQLNDQMAQFYLQKIDEQKKTMETKQIIEGISEMLSEMSKKVLDQQLMTSSFSDITSVGLNFIEEGNKNLVEANKLSKQSGKYWIYLFLSLALSVLTLDFLKS